MNEDMNKSTCCKEVSLDDTLSQILSDTDLHDVKLKGSDGVEVGANRYVLAARSSVFKAMLVGKFSEASGNTVDIAEYEGGVLEAVVEYIHTDNPHMLNTKKRKAKDDLDGKNGDSASLMDTQQIETLLSLATAANFFDLPGLTKQVKDFLSNLLEESTLMPFVLLEACNQQHPAVPEEIAECVSSKVRATYNFVGNDTAVAYLSKDTLEGILKDDQMVMAEYDLFCLLMSWVESSPVDRKPIGKSLMDLIKLEGISPIHLSSVVEPSGLATSEKLFKAYKAHSIAATELSVEKCLKGGELPFWSGTSSHDSRDIKRHLKSVLLECPPMKNGVHRWTLQRLGTNVDYVLLCGVALQSATFDPSNYLTDQKGNWGFQTDGRTYCEGSVVKQESWSMNVGEEATLTLDLRKNQRGNGTLTGSIKKKNGSTVVIGPIRNLLDHLGDDASEFVPAVEAAFDDDDEEDSKSDGFSIVGFTTM